LKLDDTNCPRVVVEWPELQQPTDDLDTTVSVAIICIGPGSELVRGLLSGGEWDLIPLTGSVSIALQHPTLTPMTLQRSAYRNTVTTEAQPQTAVDDRAVETSDDDAPIETLGTTAYLVCRRDASDALVEATLQALYREPTIVGLIPAGSVAEWPGLAFHRAARKYFDSLGN
jgi:hypothetical protein